MFSPLRGIIKINPDPICEINPKTAQKYKVADGQWARLSSPFGSSAIGFVYDATGRFDLSFYAGIGILALCAVLVVVAVSQKKIRATVWIEGDEQSSAQLHVVDRAVEQVDHQQPVADLAG